MNTQQECEVKAQLCWNDINGPIYDMPTEECLNEMTCSSCYTGYEESCKSEEACNSTNWCDATVGM